MKKSDLLEILISAGFSSLDSFKDYMLKQAKLNKYGSVCYTEARNKIELNYSDNCKHKFSIGGNIKGTFVNYRFNVILKSGVNQMENFNIWKY